MPVACYWVEFHFTGAQRSLSTSLSLSCLSHGDLLLLPPRVGLWGPAGHGHRRAHEPLSYLMLASVGTCLPSGVRAVVAVQAMAVPGAAASGRRHAMRVAVGSEPIYTDDERENCKNGTRNNALRKFAIPNIVFVKTGLQMLST